MDVLKLERSRLVKLETPRNINSILVTADVLKLERSRLVNKLVLKNILSILLTADVSVAPEVKVAKLVHP